MAAAKTPANSTSPVSPSASPASAPNSTGGVMGVRERIKQVADEARTLSELVDSIVTDPKLDQLQKRGRSLLQLLGFKVE